MSGSPKVSLPTLMTLTVATDHIAVRGKLAQYAGQAEKDRALTAWCSG